MSVDPQARLAQIREWLEKGDVNTILSVQSKSWETDSEQEEMLQLAYQSSKCKIIGTRTSKNLELSRPIHNYFHHENIIDLTLLFDRIKDFTEGTSNLRNILLQSLRGVPIGPTEILDLFRKSCDALVKSHLYLD